MDSADRKAGEQADFFGGEPAFGAGEEFQEVEPALKSGNVVSTLTGHENSLVGLERFSPNENNNRDMKHSYYKHGK